MIDRTSPAAVQTLAALWPLIAGLLVLIVAGDGTLDDLVQQRANAHVEASPAPDVVVVLVDDASVAAASGFGGRSGLACLVRLIAAQRPAVIALDYVFDAAGETAADLPPACGTANERLGAGGTPLVVASRLDWSTGELTEATPSTPFVPRNALHGYADVDYSRRDGVVRTVQLFEDAGGADLIASLPLTAWAAAQAGGSTPAPGQDELRRALAACASGLSAPSWLDCGRIAGSARRVIRFFPPRHVLNIVTVRDLFPDGCDQAVGPPCIAEAMFRGKLVFVGDSSAPGDMFETPLFSDLPGAGYLFEIDADVPMLPGVVVHALVAHNLLSGAFVETPTPLGYAVLTIVSVLATLATWACLDAAMRRWTPRSPRLAYAVRMLARTVVLGAMLLGIDRLAVAALSQTGASIHPLLLMSITLVATLFAWLVPGWPWRCTPASGGVLAGIAGPWSAPARTRYAALLQPDAVRRHWYALTVSVPASIPPADHELEAIARLRMRLLDRLAVPERRAGVPYLPLLTQFDDGAFSVLIAIDDDTTHAHEAALDALRTLAQALPGLVAGSSALQHADGACWAGTSLLRIAPERAALGADPLVVSPRPGDAGTHRMRIKPRRTPA